ncbi:MAG: hypothetical protein Q8L26_08150 [Candidatus Omnitrophota bacterium]|nr:hypothetical protein [Candidatus Omnitrophota bacterium]
MKVSSVAIAKAKSLGYFISEAYNKDKDKDKRQDVLFNLLKYNMLQNNIDTIDEFGIVR